MNLFRKKPIQSYTQSDLIACLTTIDLIFLGIGAIIGAGIFVITGVVAATQAGPAIVLSYILAGLACTFSALSYAELASSIGGCGSAYNYAYAGFGELIAWIVGWDLLLEYAISVSTVAVGWSAYLRDLMTAIHLSLPSHKFQHFGDHFDLWACSIIFLLSFILAIGVKISSRVNNTMVLIKLSVILLFIIIASTNVDIANWKPFAPYGWKGIAEGASLIFFAYIGFDAVSTTAEEAINPQKSLPKGIIGSLLISTLIYIVVDGLLTDITPYTNLNNSSPISHIMLKLGYKISAGFVGVGAVAGLTTVMLVMFYGLTRVFFALSRDGLLPAYFSKINQYTKTPIRIILLCTLIIAPISALMPMHELAELVNVGTLFAFITVCAGVIFLRYNQPNMPRPFKTPFNPLIPILGILSCFYLIINLPWITLARFFIWMLIGFLIYFSYSRFHSAQRLDK
jgi:APA family basic amino acid/polyamine antiporter